MTGPLPHESARAEGGNLKKNPDAFTLYFYFARTASIHFHKAQLCQHDITISISIYFQLNSHRIDLKKIISSFLFVKDQLIYCHSQGSKCMSCMRQTMFQNIARSQMINSFSVNSLSAEPREMKGNVLSACYHGQKFESQKKLWCKITVIPVLTFEMISV